MKTFNLYRVNKNFLFVIAGTLVLLAGTACARKVNFMTSTIVPAAEGKVKVKKDDNNNYSIKINIENLAEPGRLVPGRKTYVVWMSTENNSIKNIGQINSSSGLFSSKLKASFETVSSFKPRKIFITAEDDAAIQYPGMQVVLSTDNF
jgi:hypothetical protein